MLRKTATLSIVSLLTTFSLNAYAQSINDFIVVAPTCLIKKTDIFYTQLSKQASLVLIKTSKANIALLNNAKHENAKQRCGGFMDVTAEWNEYIKSHHYTSESAQAFLTAFNVKTPGLKQTSYPALKYGVEVRQLLNQLNPQIMWENLTTLTNFKDRYADSDTGVETAKWIKTQIETWASNNHRNDVTVSIMDTPSYRQPSVIAKIGTSNDAAIVIGGHMDTLLAKYSKKPGADDDGSGTATALEVARVLLSSGMEFKKPIYLVWYAAEEEGLKGSQRVAADFKNKKIPVAAVLHFDMTGFAYRNDPTIWLMKDYTNKELNTYLETLITTYVKQPVKYSACGYACSDHASWTYKGYPAAIAAEAAYENTNPNLHSANDTIDKLSISHMTDYAKTGIALAVEGAEPIARK